MRKCCPIVVGNGFTSVQAHRDTAYVRTNMGIKVTKQPNSSAFGNSMHNLQQSLEKDFSGHIVSLLRSISNNKEFISFTARSATENPNPANATKKPSGRIEASVHTRMLHQTTTEKELHS